MLAALTLLPLCALLALLRLLAVLPVRLLAIRLALSLPGLCVSHALETLERLCDRGMWLEHGRVMKIGKVSEVLKAYRESAIAQAPVAAQTS